MLIVVNNDNSWWSMVINGDIPSGKHLHNYGKITSFLIGKSAINGPCSIAMLNYQRVNGYSNV